MKSVFVETSNYRRFTAAMTRLDERGAPEACMMVVDGKPGLGKTATMRRWMVQTGSIYLRAHPDWDYGWFVNDLLTELMISDIPRVKRERFSLIIQRLGDLATEAALEGRHFGLLIDEVDLISSKPSIMEAIRAISDVQFLPTILVGMGKLRDNLRRFAQIESRAPSKVEFRPATLEDATALVRGLSEVPVADDLIKFVWKLSNGYSREMVDAIRAIERFGQRIDPGPQGVTIADMAGQVIMNNRDSGKDIVVPEAI